MKKLLIALVMLLPILGKAQTKPTHPIFYDSVGNAYYNDTVRVIVENDSITKPHPTKTKTVIRKTVSGRKLKYTITY
tara:strand:+ start:847 stop:1077 length:231 start_codon:yes stop_codon:yes gene_type:complete